MMVQTASAGAESRFAKCVKALFGPCELINFVIESGFCC